VPCAYAVENDMAREASMGSTRGTCMRAYVHACRVHTLLSQLTRIAIAMLLPGQQRIAIELRVAAEAGEYMEV